ncbi:MAG: gliding motility-associated ABC transporter substrate-binding protein GldG, partial [Bacteroidota bacterium]
MVNWNQTKLTHILFFLTGLGFVVIANQLAERFRFRWDLTEEQRYSVTQPTKDMLSELEESVYVDVYLEGELPANFKRFRNSIAETLDEFKVYSGGKVQYRFIDPSIASSPKAKNEFYTYLAQSGIQPSNLTYKTEDNTTERLIFPGAIVSYFGAERGVLLLKGNQSDGADEVINQSIEGVEYQIATAIKELSSDSRKKIGMLKGHGELDSAFIAGFTNVLKDRYDLFNVNLKNRKESLNGYDLLVLAKPTKKFSQQDKYLLDQYIMRGGKLLAFIDALKVDLDSIGGVGTLAFPYDNDLTDLFFRYGVRVNMNYVQDINSGQMPFVTGQFGDQPKFDFMPWPYFPVINRFGDHPMVKGIGPSIGKFVSTIDTVKAVGVKKTPLMYTSQYSRVMSSPVRVSVDDIRSETVPERFQAGSQPVAYLLEGTFTSLFKNRLVPQGFAKNDFVPGSGDNKMIVVADGDFIRNEFDPKTQNPVELGVDPYTGQVYSNPD